MVAKNAKDGLVTIDSGASVNVCPKWFGKSKTEQSDGTLRLRGADGKLLQEYGKRQIWLRIGGLKKRHDFHVVDVTKPILSVSHLCENGDETHLAKQPFLRFGGGHDPLIRRGGVYFVKAQTVNAVDAVTHDQSVKSCVQPEDAQKWCVQPGDAQTWCAQHEDAHKWCVQPGDAQTWCVQPEVAQKVLRTTKRCTTVVRTTRRCTKSGAYNQEMHNSGAYNRSVHKIDAHEKEIHKIDAFIQKIRKIDARREVQ